jgi:intergrase/recombinase
MASSAIVTLPSDYSKFFVFCTLTGLRASECNNCIRLIQDSEAFKTYYNESRQRLQHYIFTDTFTRRTKAAYISLVSNEFLDIARNACNHSYNSFKMIRHYRNIDIEMDYCRKTFASHLRQSGIESEIVGLLEGRVPKTVFARHYFRPSLEHYRDRVVLALNGLQKQIEQ